MVEIVYHDMTQKTVDDEKRTYIIDGFDLRDYDDNDYLDERKVDEMIKREEE